MRRLLTALIVLLVLLVAADRIGVAVASNVIASKLRVSAGLSSEPSVDIRGFPFLTQALAGRYDQVDLHTGALSRGGVRLARFDVSLHGVQLGLSAALSGRVISVPVEGLTATAVVTYADVATRGIAGIAVTPLGSEVRVTGRVTLLGQSVTATTDSTVRLDGTSIVITAQKVSVLGVSSGVVNSALAGRMDFRVPVGRLPYGLALSGVHPTASGLVLVARSGPTIIAVPAPAS